jgi:hypothetical protein
MRCCDATASPLVAKVRGEVFAVCVIDCLACQDESFVNNLFDVKKDEHALDFAPHLSHLSEVFGLQD